MGRPWAAALHSGTDSKKSPATAVNIVRAGASLLRTYALLETFGLKLLTQLLHAAPSSTLERGESLNRNLPIVPCNS